MAGVNIAFCGPVPEGIIGRAVVGGLSAEQGDQRVPERISMRLERKLGSWYSPIQLAVTCPRPTGWAPGVGGSGGKDRAHRPMPAALRKARLESLSATSAFYPVDSARTIGKPRWRPVPERSRRRQAVPWQAATSPHGEPMLSGGQSGFPDILGRPERRPADAKGT